LLNLDLSFRRFESSGELGGEDCGGCSQRIYVARKIPASDHAGIWNVALSGQMGHITQGTYYFMQCLIEGIILLLVLGK
jgi:hypothetical protein